MLINTAHPTAKWDIPLPSPSTNQDILLYFLCTASWLFFDPQLVGIFFYIFSLQQVGYSIFLPHGKWDTLPPLINWNILLHRCCLFKSNTVFKSDEIALR